MHIHTFRAESLQAALQQVRRQLGPDAAILHTREKRQGRLGIFARPIIEVDATLGTANSDPLNSDSATDSRADSFAVQPATNQSAPNRAETNRVETNRAETNRAETNRAGAPEQFMLREPSALPEQSARAAATTSPEQRADRQNSRMQPQQLASQQPVDQQSAAQQIAARLKLSGAIELSANKPHVVALVGPTGCGKTTSLAKLAAGFRFDQGCHVGLVALDTFRLGAVDQLLQHADMLSAPLEVVSSVEQVPAAIQRLRNCDLVLIDTAGRAPRDAVRLAELREFLELSRPHSTQLVISASSSTAHVSQTIECFSVLKPTDLLITKLDEAVDFGSWLTLLERTSLPISYLTHGQRVPQDISPATAESLASLLLDQQLNFQQQGSQRQAVQRGDFQREPGELQLSN